MLAFVAVGAAGGCAMVCPTQGATAIQHIDDSERDREPDANQFTRRAGDFCGGDHRAQHLAWWRWAAWL